MAKTVSSVTQALIDSSQITPVLVLEIDGHTTLYSSGAVTGGSNVEQLISFQKGTTTVIKQTLKIDKGLGESISSMNIAIVDKDLEVTENLLTPDTTQTPDFDVLGRRCRVWYGFEGGTFKDDFVIIFRGVIHAVKSSPGLVTLQINHPDDKKKSTLFNIGETLLNGALTDSATTVTVDDTTPFLGPITQPDGTTGIDSNLTLCLRINDEVMSYTGTTATTFTGVTRGILGTTAAAHSDNDTVESFIRLQGNAMDVALKLMFSGTDGPMFEDKAVTHFVDVGTDPDVPNAIFFADPVDVVRDYGLTVGDFVTVTGASNGANNVTDEPITSIDSNDEGTYIVVGGASLVLESSTSAVIDFRSQYDTLGEGARMKGDEVDVAEHLSLKSQFLSNFEYDFYIKEELDLKEFLSGQVYNPAGAFSLPRNEQASVGYHLAGQLPTANTKEFDLDNVLNPKELQIQRSTSKNFFNSVTYKWEEQVLEEKFLRILATLNTDSLDRIPIGNKTLIIESKGLRDTNSAANLAATATDRRLKKYKFGAEFIQSMEVLLRDGFTVEVGDTVSVDIGALKMTDIVSGTRSGDARLFEVVNKQFDIKKGLVKIDVVDTNFDRDARFCLVGPSSEIASGTSTTVFTIQQTFVNPLIGTNEYKKWEDFDDPKFTGVVVRTADYVTSDTSTLDSASSNVITVTPALSFTPASGYFMESDLYDNAASNYQLLYGFMSDTAFGDGSAQYVML